eukprot:8395450-Ditylum_brightwellii.AAC.2
MKVESNECEVLAIKRGESEPTETDVLPDIPLLDENDGYRYLGIYEGTDFLTDQVKAAATKKYQSCVHSILKAQLTGVDKSGTEAFR